MFMRVRFVLVYIILYCKRDDSCANKRRACLADANSTFLPLAILLLRISYEDRAVFRPLKTAYGETYTNGRALARGQNGAE